MDKNWFKKLFINEAKPALNRHSGSSQGAIVPLTITANGTYTPPEGIAGFSPVTISVPGVITKLDTPTIYLE